MNCSKLYVVQIVEDSTGEVVKDFEPQPYNKACKIESGVSINMDHERFSTYIEVYNKEQE
ncbi:MAG: hypothetical protein CL489_08420 [Acidobacteria bacterium]|nr:hypothetical protein [Acidobacteriota bacterium]|tara:strand:- start:56143 stop:56322 length:180 start_codon:yes stop_codon:yes gene_type:complete